MLKKVCCSFLVISIFLTGLCVAGVGQKESHQLINSGTGVENVLSGFFNFFSSPDPTEPLIEEILSLKTDLQKLEAQQKQILEMLNAVVNDSKTQKDRIGDSEELQHILIRYGNNPDGMSALHYAIKMGDVRAVELLIANEADINATNQNFFPITRAANCNQIEVAKTLLNNGADVNVSRNNYSTGEKSAICYAAVSGSGDLIRLFIEYGAYLDRTNPAMDPRQHPSMTPLDYACEAGNFDAVVALVNGGSTINGNYNPSQPSSTPLDHAARKLKYSDNPRNLELIQFLVENGAIRYRNSYNLPCPVIQGYLQSKGK